MAVTSDFTSSELDLNGKATISGPTALAWGPDGRLYVTEVTGDVNVLSVAFGDKDPLDPENSAQFYVTDAQVLTDVKSIQNYNDDGTLASEQTRQVTGIDVTKQFDANGEQVFFDGKPAVVIYVTSSDSRVGGSGGGADEGLDTNSGVITQLTEQPDGSFVAVDIVRGLARSEENHATNGLEVIQEIDENGVLISERLIVANGGNANTGAPSNNFAAQQETPYSAAILEVDLDQLKGMPVLIDGNGRSYVYDIPTLDDPTRDGLEENDPFGGNDGLNSGILTFDSPVQIYSAGYRNSFDVEVTEDGRVWTYDNGANDNWGGRPAGEDEDGDVDATEPETGTPAGYIATNLFVEDNNELAGDFDPQNWDGLHEVTRSDDLGLRELSAGEGGATTYTWVHPDLGNLELVYGGHPNPTRAEGARAGLLYSPNNGTTGAKLMVSNVAKPDGAGGETSDFLEVVTWLLEIGYTDAFINGTVVALEPGVTYGDTFATGFGGDGPEGRPTAPGVFSLVEDENGEIGLPLDIGEIVHALNPVEGNYREAGFTDGAVDTNKGSVNGLTEYTSTILDDPENGIKMSGALWASTFTGSYLLIGRNADGIVETTTSSARTVAADKTTIQADGGPLGLASIGDDLTAFGGEQAFQGTVWAAIYKENGPVIEIFQPGNPDTNALLPVYAGQVANDPTDNDLDGIDHINDPFEYSVENGFALSADETLLMDFQLNPPDPNFSASLGDSGLLGAVLDGITPNRDALTIADGFTDPAILRNGLFDNGGNLIIGANAPLVQIKEVADGTAIGTANTLRDGLQTGVRIDSDVKRLTAEIDITNWTADQAPIAGRKTGLMFGGGTQSDFVRLSFGDIGGGIFGLEVGLEVDDTYMVLGAFTDAAFTTALTAFATTEEKIALGQKVVVLQLEITDIGSIYGINARYAIKGETEFNDIPLSGATLPEGVLRDVLDGSHQVSDGDTMSPSGAAIGLFAEKDDGVDFTAVDFNEIRINAFGNEILAENAADVGAPGTDGSDTVIYIGTETELAPLDAAVENFDGTGSSADYTIIANDGDNVIAVGPGTNTIVSGAGSDIIKGELTDLSGDTITDFSGEDAVLIEGLSTGDIIGDVTYSVGSAILTINGQSLIFDGPDFENFEAVDGPPSFTFADTDDGLKITSRDPLTAVVAINAGGTGEVTGTLRERSLTFVGDEGGEIDGPGFTTPGATGSYTNTFVADLDFPDTDLDDVLQIERSAKKGFGYEVTLPNGTYVVDLIFAELFFGIPGAGSIGSGPGDRVFDVVIEGVTAIDNLDIFTEAGGAGLELIKSYQVDVTDGSLSIDLPSTDTADGEVDQAKLSGLVVWATGGGFVPLDTVAPVVDEITLANPLNFNDGERELTIVLSDETGFASIDFAALDGSEVTFIGYTPDAISAPTPVLSDDDKTATLTYNVTGEGNAWADGVVGEISFAANAITDAAGNGNKEASGGFVVQPNLDSLERGAVMRAINLGTTDAIVGTLDPDQAEGGTTDDNSYGGALTDTIITDAFGNFVTFEADNDVYHTSPKASLNANVDGAAGTTGSNSAGIDLDGSAYHTYRDSTAGAWTSTYTGFANGSYIVELHFAELFHATEAEARVGDFTVNGRLIPEAENYNAFSSAQGGAGADRPSFIRVPITVTDGTITVDVQSDFGEAAYSAVVIYGAVDPNLPPSISVGDTVVAEGGLAEVTFTRIGDLSEAVTITYSLTSGTAQASDFGTASPNPVVIAVGEASATVSFLIIEDDEEEEAETVTVTIDSATVPLGGPVTIADGSATVTIQPSDNPFQAPVGAAIFNLDFEGVSGEAITVGGFDGTLGDEAITLDEATSEIVGGKLTVQTTEGDINDGTNNESINDFTKTADVSDPALTQIFLTTRFDNPFTADEFLSQGIVDDSLPEYAQQGLVFGTGSQATGQMVKLVWGGVAASQSSPDALGVQMWSKGSNVDQKVAFSQMVQVGTDQFDVASVEMSLMIDKGTGTVGMYVTLFDANGAILGGVRPEPTVGFATALPQGMPGSVAENLISDIMPTHFGVTSTDNSSPVNEFESFEATWDYLNLSSPQFTDPGLPPTISVGDILVAEGGLAEVTFTRTGDLSEAVTIAYSLTADTAQAADFGTATPNPVIINAGDATATMSFQIIDDGDAEGTETITVAIDSATVPSSDPVTIADGSATVTIEPSDFPPDSINGIPVADGDFSDIHDGPRDILVLAEGATEIVATQQGDNAIGGRDRDFITFTVAAGQELTGIVLKDYTGGLEGGAISQGFIAIQEGPIVSYDQDNPVVEDVALLLGSHIYNESDVQGVNFNDGNILDEMGSDQGYGSIGFTGPLSAGTYTLWLNQGADEPKTVTFDLIAAAAINDAPTVSSNSGLSVDHGTTYAFLPTDLQATDVDNTAAELVYTVSASPSEGQLSLNGSGLGVGDTFTQADVDAGLLGYTHGATPTLLDSFSYTLTDGIDTLPASSFDFTIVPPALPTPNDDSIIGTPEANGINLLAGNDVYEGRAGNDTINGGSGNDTIDGGADNDLISGRNGNDSLTGGAGNDEFEFTDTSDGFDVITDFTQGEDVINLRLAGVGTVEELTPTLVGSDTVLTYGSSQITLEGFTGTLIADDFVFIGTGTPEDDVLNGNRNPNTFNGLAGNDRILGKGANDTLFGGADNDALIGGRGEDQLFGGDGNDVLQAGSEDDLLDGGADNDILIGLDGNDTLTGGTGDDIFVFNRAGDIDTVTDFTQGEDLLRLKPLGITDISQVTQTDNGLNLDLTFGTNTVILEDLAGTTLVDDDFAFA